MTNEVKEILDNLKYCKEHDEENNYYPEDIFSKDEPYILLDYITNLQQENDDLKEQVDYQNTWREEYINRINKAIEYIQTEFCQIDEDTNELVCWHLTVKPILDILNGEE